MPDSPAASSGAWKTRPIFISSTFRDMHAERDCLRHRVFPRIEEELRRRRHLLEPIDLRLGVESGRAGSEEERELLVLKVCLDEIKRSRPYLVVLLGDRYGWMPPEDRMEAAAQEQGFDADLAGKSVTALEIEFGILKEDPDQRQRSLFFFRRPLPYADMPAVAASRYSDAHSDDPRVRAAHGKLAALKEKLGKDPELGPRVFEYSAGWDPVAGRVAGLEGFEALVYRHLWAALDEETRDHVHLPPPTWQDEERESLAEFVENRRRDFTGRVELLRDLESLARSSAEEEATWGACLTGPPGSGKSAVFAELHQRLSADPSLLVLANAAGGTARGAEVDAVLRRWIGEMVAALGVADPLPGKSTPDEVENAFHSLLHRAARGQRVVVLMDALNEFEGTPRGQHLTWLKPARWPDNARLIATAVPGNGSAALRALSGIEKPDLQPLTPKDIEEIGYRVFRRYHRAIDPELIRVLAEKRLPNDTPAAGNSLWLTLALEQLNLLDADDFRRAEREFAGSPTVRMRAMLLDTARRMPPGAEGLYGWLLKQTSRVFGLPHARGFAVAVWLSRLGWRESDLLDLTPRLGRLMFPGEQVEHLDDLKIAALRRAFRSHLIRRGRLGQLDFLHAQMRQAVQAWAALPVDDERRLHGAIADHLEGLAGDDPLRESEMMVHLIGARDSRRAAAVYAGLTTPLGERSGATDALVRFLLGGQATPEIERVSWVCSLLDTLGLTNMETEGLGQRFNYDLDPALEKSAPLAVRESLLKAAARAWERLAASDPGNAGWQRDLSVSHNKVGDVQVAQGDLVGALRSHRESLATAERLVASGPANAGWQRDLSVSFERVGDVQVAQGDMAGALRSYRESLAIRERLSASDPGNAGLQRDQSVSQAKVGDVRVAQGDLVGALRSYREFLAIAERLAASDPGNASRQRDLSVSRERVGNVQVARGDLAGALRSYRESLAIRERLAATDPGHAGWQRDLSVGHNEVGGVQVAQGDLAGALRSYQESLAIRERLTTTDRGNAGWQRDLSVGYNKVGDVQVAQGDLAGALRSYRESLAIAERLAATDPGHAGWQRDLSVSQEKVGSVQVAQGDLAGALQSYQESLAIRERLAATDPGHTGWQRDLSVSQEKVGDVRVAEGDLAGALRSYRESLAIRERLTAMDPGHTGWQRDLSVSQEKVGDVRVAQGDLAGALRSYRESLATAERLAASDPGHAGWQRDLSASLDRVGDVLVAQGDLAGALRSYRESLAIAERLAAMDPGDAGGQRDLWVSCWKMATISGRMDNGDARDLWLMAHQVLSGMKERGILLSRQDECFLAQLREKLGQ